MKRTAAIAVLGLAVLGASLASAVTPPERAALPAVSMEPVHFAWALAPDQVLESPTPHRAISREYRSVVDGAALRTGIQLPLTGTGAILRLNPSGSATSIDPTSLRLRTADGREIAAGSGLESLVDAAAMKAAGAPFVDGTSAVRIAADLTGHVTLTADAADGRWVVSVFEPTSPYHLRAEASALSYLAGETAAATLTLRGATDLRLETATGTLVTPAGAVRPATLSRINDRTWRVEADLRADDLRPGALWEFQLSTVGRAGDLEIRRDVSTAFSVAAPVARLAAAPVRRANNQALTVAAPVEATAAGRYEIRSVVWGTDADGIMRPAAVAHSARFLPAGHGEIILTVDHDVLTTHGLTAPWQIRTVQLLDQGRMGLLQEITEPLHLD